MTAPHALSLGDPNYTAANIAEPMRQGWRDELAEIGGRSPLLHFVDGPRTRIELSTTHPGGLAQFITGKTTLLSQPHPRRPRPAHRQARRRRDRRQGPRTAHHARHRLRPPRHRPRRVAARRRSSTARRSCCARSRSAATAATSSSSCAAPRSSTRRSPRALDEQFGIALDADAFVALADARRRRSSRTRSSTACAASPRTCTGSTCSRGSSSRPSPMSPPACARTPPTSSTRCSTRSPATPRRKWAVEESYAPVEPQRSRPAPARDRHPAARRRRRAGERVAQIAAGNSLVVKTLPGTGGTQTIVNALGCLVAPEQARARGQPAPRDPERHRPAARRHRAAGLRGRAAHAAPRPHPLDRPQREGRASRKLGEVDDALVRLRKVLLDYRGALARRDPALGVSVLDCVTELSRLALLPDAAGDDRAARPRDRRAPRARPRRRPRRRCSRPRTLGEFRYGPATRPGTARTFANERGRDARARARQAAAPRRAAAPARARERAHRRDADAPVRDASPSSASTCACSSTSATPSTSSCPRSSTARSASSSPRPRRAGTPRRCRARTAAGCKKLAREYVRPGVHVERPARGARAHPAAAHRCGSASSPPASRPRCRRHRRRAGRLPAGRRRTSRRLDAPLGVTEHASAARRTCRSRTARQSSAGLAADSDVLHNLQERSALASTAARAASSTRCSTDLAARHVPEDQVAAELELAWWQSALESLLAADRALLGANTAVLDRLEADFRLVDEAHAAGSAQLLAWQLAENWKIGLVDWPDEAAALKRAAAPRPHRRRRACRTPPRTCRARSRRSGWPRRTRWTSITDTHAVSTPSCSSTPAR